METLIQTQELCKFFQAGESEVRALDHVNLTVEAGEFVAIIGHSGSGKSTLMTFCRNGKCTGSNDLFLRYRNLFWDLSRQKGGAP